MYICESRTQFYKMKNLPVILIVLSVVLIILNFIFTSDEMNLGFWLRTLGSASLIISMLIVIKQRKRQLNE